MQEALPLGGHDGLIKRRLAPVVNPATLGYLRARRRTTEAPELVGEAVASAQEHALMALGERRREVGVLEPTTNLRRFPVIPSVLSSHAQ